MEKRIPSYPLTVAREEMNSKYQGIWHGENLTLRTRSIRKLIKNDESPLPPASGEMPEGKRGGPTVVECGGSGGDDT
jgi:hypothetical protein